MNSVDKGEKPENLKEKLEALSDTVVQKSHTTTINNQQIDYETITGRTVVNYEREGDTPLPKAEVFFVAYFKTGEKNLRNRPITFVFNGGPGSSSIWLHMGMIGPKVVEVEKDGQPVSPPYNFINNPHCLLDVTDFVCIDPVSTGYSRSAPGTKASEFHTYKMDLELVGEFIRKFVTQHKRWNSPKFILGESYGTTRASALTDYLLEKFGMRLSGLILVSVVLNFQTIIFHSGNELPYSVFLPSYAASAWYHKKLNSSLSLKEVTSKAKNFIENEYLSALYKGNSLTEDESRHLAQQLAQLTGLDSEYLERTNLRVDIYRYAKELLRKQGKTIGRFDARFTGIDRDNAGEKPEFDPSYSVVLPAYTENYLHYINNELGYTMDIPYKIFAPIYEIWKYDTSNNEYLDVSELLRKVMTRCTDMKVFLANGYYDLATPFAATEYTINHMNLPAGLQKNMIMQYYEGGHMMYTNHKNLIKLNMDLREFYKQCN